MHSTHTKTFFALLLVVLLPAPVVAQEAEPPSSFDASITAELGSLQALAHSIQFGKNGTYVDYVEEGGQDILFPFARLSIDLALSERHNLTFLYQPLSLQTTEVAERDLIVDDQLYPAGTPMAFRYDFPFYRVSYLYDMADDPKHELAFGASLQIRDARIEFSTLGGDNLRTNRDVGPVPVLKFRGRYGFDNGFFLATEMDGFYAPIKYLNGGKSDVVGAILDGSVRAGLDLNEDVSGFLNLRYLGGGAEGTSKSDNGPGDGYNKNWLQFMTVSLGITYQL